MTTILPDPLRFAPLKFEGVKFKTRSDTTRIVIHTLDTKRNWKEDIREIDRWHREERKWIAIGYHYVILRDDTVLAGRPMDAVGAHTEGWNSTSVSIALSGGKGGKRGDLFETNYTPEQRRVLILLVQGLRRIYGRIPILGHHDHPKVTKNCPCFAVEELKNEW